MSAGNILVVDDEPEIRRLVKEVLEDESYQVTTAENADVAQDEVEKLHTDLVLLDIWMPNTDGMALLQRWSDSGGLPCPVVMMSGHGNIETAVEALRLGAYDFIEKPVSMAKLLVTVQRALQAETLRKENIQLKRRIETGSELIAKSPAMLQLKEDIERVAPTDFWVLVSGEPGAGKAVAARYLHSHSTRKNGPLVEISLAATPKENMAVQLFGSGEGQTVSPGSFEQAEGGILVLDEIGDLDLDTQGRLVSALEDNRFIRVGGTSVIDMNVRIVATAQHDLAAEVKAGRFREDLFYRLNVVPLKVPPLRERLEDIEPLCQQYVAWLTEFEHLPRKQFSDQAINALKQYPWPGNVRELKNVIQRLMILCRNDEISAEDVRKAIGYDLGGGEQPMGNFDQTLRSARDEFERAYLLHHLERNNGNVSALAERSGMERTHLYRKLKQLGINPKTLKNK
jgi:two-component system nitrogen regulation response regulator NtrX